MLRTITGLPPGVIGIEAIGEVHGDDYRAVLRPAVDQAIGRGQVRLVYVLGDEFTGYSAGAVAEDFEMGFDHISGWVRTAVVSDVEWVVHLAAAFGWLVPGELRRFPLDQRAEAVRWAAGDDEPSPEPPDEQAAGSDAPFVPVVEVEPSPAIEETAPVPTVDPTVAMPAAQPSPYEPFTPIVPVNPGREMQPGFVAAVPAQPAVPAQWAADPAGRHQHRWWDGERWTEHVADNGISGSDPLS